MATFDPTKSNNLQEFAKFRGVMFFGLLCVHNIVWPTGGPQMCSKVWGEKSYLKTHIASPRRQPPNQQQKQ